MRKHISIWGLIFSFCWICGDLSAASFDQLKIYYFSGQYDQAQHELDALKKDWPVLNMYWNYYQGSIYFKKNQLQASIPFLKRSLLSHPSKTAEIKFRLYLALRKTGQNDQIEALSAEQVWGQIERCISLSMWDEAEEWISYFNKKDASDLLKAQVRFTQAKMAFEQQKWDQAENIWEEDSSPKARYFLALLSERKNDLSEAENRYQKIIQDFSDSEFAVRSLDRLASIRPENESHIEQIWSRYPESYAADDAYWNKGWQAYTQGDLSKAFDLWLKGSELPAGDQKMRILFWLFKSSVRLGKSSELYFEKMNAFSPYHYYSLRAREILSKPLKLSPEDSQTSQVKSFSPVIEALLQLHAYSEALERAQSEDERIAIVKRAWRAKNYYIATREGEKTNKWLWSFPKVYTEIKNDLQGTGLHPYFGLALIREESRFNPLALSSSGARGLMQIMPATGHSLAKQLKLSTDVDLLFDADSNMKMGALYLKYLSERFKNNRMAILSGYNAGPNITQKWLNNLKTDDSDEWLEKIPYAETNNYIKKVLRSYWLYLALYGS